MNRALLIVACLLSAHAFAQDDSIVIGSPVPAAPPAAPVKPPAATLPPVIAPTAAPQTVAPQAEAAPVGDVPAGVDPRAYAAAQELVKLFDMKSLLQGMMGVMNKSMAPMIEQDNPGQGDRIEKITADVTQKVVMSHMAELEKNKAIVYTQMFTVPELQQLKKFYQSPLGQKTLQTTPEMMRRNAALDQEIMAATVDEARRQLAAELKKNGMKIPKAMGV